LFTFVGALKLSASGANFDKKFVGLHFGPLFHELIWSPWIAAGDVILESAYRPDA
jgi:hypothetical protein